MKRRRRRLGRRRLGAVSLLLSMVLALVGNLATNTIRIDEAWWPPVVWSAVGLLVLWVLAHTVSRRPDERDTTPDDPVCQAKKWLVAQEKHLLASDVDRAQLRRPVPLRVRWSSTSRPVAASRSVVLNVSADAAWRDSPLEGDIGEIVTEFRGLPNRQLVILGGGGAGKSSLSTLLGLGLLEHRETASTKLTSMTTDSVVSAGDLDADHPIPVYLSIASWHPERELIEEFVVRRLHEQFQFPDGVSEEYGTCFADVLLHKGCLLPVLDGLDELPIELRATAIGRLEAFAAAARPFVLTCRTAEYEQTVEHSGLVLSRAAVVEIEPVDVESAITFLSESSPSAQRWTDVFAHLRGSPDSPLAQVLSTPLMVSLARIAYRPAGTNPRALLKPSDFTSIAGALLDQYVSSAYPARLRPKFVLGNLSSGYHPVKVTRWLAYLAHHLYQSGQRDLRWWRLTPALVPKILQGPGFLLGFSILIVLVTTTLASRMVLDDLQSVELAVVASVIVGIGTSGLFSSLWPTKYQLPGLLPRTRRTGIWFGVLIGALGGVLVASPPTGLSAGLLCGLHAAFVPHWSVREMPRLAPELRSRRSSPARTVAINRWNAALAAVQYGIVGAVAFAVADSVSPGPSNPLQTATMGAAVCAVSAAYCAGLGLWTRFRLTCLLLALFGRLPWRLLTFLNDARERGALRQAGDSWQFRHALLQDHLSEKLQPTNLWTRIKSGETAAVNRLADLYAAKGRIGELRAIADLDNQYVTFRLVDTLEELGCVSEAIQIAQDRANAGDAQATTRLIDLLARHGRIGELRAIADLDDQLDDQYVTFRLVDTLEELGCVSEAIQIAQDRANAGDAQATTRLIDLLADHGRIDALQRYARARNSRAITRLARIHVDAAEIDEVVALARIQLHTNGWRAAEPILDLLSRHGRIDDILRLAEAHAQTLGINESNWLATCLAQHGRIDALRTLAREGNRLAADRVCAELVTLGHAEQAIAIAADHAAAGGWTANKRLIQLMASTGRLADAATIAKRLASTGNQLANEMYHETLAASGAHDTIQALASDGDIVALGHHARHLAETGPVLDAVAFARCHAGQLELTDLLTVMDAAVKHGHIDTLRFLSASSNTRVVLHLVHLLALAGNADGGVALAFQTGTCDSRTTGEFLDVLVTIDRVDDALRLAQRHDPRRFGVHTTQLVDHLVAHGRSTTAIDVLHQFVQSGDAAAIDRMIRLLATTGRTDQAILLAEETANPRSDAWSNVDRLIELLTKRGRIDDAIAIAKLRADHSHDATWTRLRTARPAPAS